MWGTGRPAVPHLAANDRRAGSLQSLMNSKHLELSIPHKNDKAQDKASPVVPIAPLPVEWQPSGLRGAPTDTLGWRPARPRPAERAATSRPAEDGAGLTCSDPGRLGIVPVLDAGDQLAAVLQRVPAHQGGLAPATLGRAKTSGGKAKLCQKALLPLRSVCSRSRAPQKPHGADRTRQARACRASVIKGSP